MPKNRTGFNLRPDRWVVPLLASLTALMGLVNLLSGIFPALPERMLVLEQFSPLEVRHGSHLTSVLAGFVLLVLSANLWRRKQVAWLLASLTLLVSAFSHLFKGLDYEEALLALLLVALLLANRHRFYARSDLPSLRSGLVVLLVAVLFTLVYGTAGFYLLDRHFKVHYDFISALRQTMVMFTQFYDPGLHPLTGFGRYFGDSIYVVAAATMFYSMVMLVRPVLVREPASPAERERAAALVAAWGQSALSPYMLLPDKSYYFSPQGTLFSYVNKGGVALVLADPPGPPENLPAALTAFAQHCTRNDWLPVYYQVQAQHLGLYHQLGYKSLMIGQEALVDLATFSLEGKAGKEFRTTLNKMERLGLQAEMHLPPLSAALLERLRAVSDEWLANMHGNELQFATGWFDDEYIRSSPVMTISAADGELMAFANVIQADQGRLLAVDLMRRRESVENGTMDFLFIALLRWARQQGALSFSLGLSALSGLTESAENLSSQRALHYIYENTNRFYNFRGLHAFKEKFHPQWQARYLVYPGTPSLPRVGMALVRANSGDDFWWSYFRP